MTQQEVIKKFMKSLDKTKKKGEAALDEAIQACSNFKSFQDLKDSMIQDCKNAKSADDFLKTYCGIDYSTEDNGAITGSDAGGSTSKTDASIIPESGSLKTCTKSSFKVNGLTVKLGDKKTYGALTAAEKFIWNGLYTWWIEGALDLIEESYGSNFGFGSKSSATVKEISVTFNNDKSSIAVDNSYNILTGKTSTLKLNINMKYWSSMKNNLQKANSEFDRTIAHELAHAVMMANILYKPVYNSLPGFVKEGLAELTVGIEKKFEKGTYSLKNLAENSSSLKSALNEKKTDTGLDNMNSGGYMFFRYLALQASNFTVENETDSTVLTFSGNDTIKNAVSKATIKSGAGNDDIHNWSNDVMINGGTDDDFIYNYNSLDGGDKVTIDGGDGDDCLISWGDKVSMVGGTGNDTILNGTSSVDAGGLKVSIYGGEGNDYILNWGGAALIYGGDGNDSIWGDAGNDKLYGGKGNDSLFGDAGKDSLYGAEGDDYLSGGKGDDYLSGSNGNDTLDGGAGDDILDGGDDNDSLFGDAGNDSLSGGLGNDSLSGGAGDDKLDGGEGNDLLKGGDGNDTLDGGAGDDILDGGDDNDSLFGDAGNDSLSGGLGNDSLSGGAGNDELDGGADSDELYGGAGNDMLWGGGGADTFIYAKGDGNDIICDFANDDMLKINSTFSASYNKSKKEIYFKVGSTENAITLKNFTATSFNINGTNYKINDTILEKEK